MPLAARVQSQRDRSGVTSRPIGLVICPNCRVVMPRISLKPSEEENSLYEALHRCPQCSTETRRWIAL
jgi:hypothetical protein